MRWSADVVLHASRPLPDRRSACFFDVNRVWFLQAKIVRQVCKENITRAVTI